MHSFAPFWNPQSKTGENRTWPKQPRKGENERPLSSSSLPSTSAKGGCEEKLTRIKFEYANDIWSPFFWFPFQLRWVPISSVMFNCVDYDYETITQGSRFPGSVVQFHWSVAGFWKKRNPTKQGRGVPTNLWAWRTDSELRKHEKLSCWFLTKSC